ncbi:hypothetical protein ALC62_06581 [Cyphomyrmex costatus]|uniref:Uncharacterized protein n=1 Tax=Cyphomyrmex costatus TaxID=456900 RepID=A0A151IIW1_9HYME|nr:hypothetical protein ALC62_06581 [Cyphomyrmex costatus]
MFAALHLNLYEPTPEEIKLLEHIDSDINIVTWVFQPRHFPMYAMIGFPSSKSGYVPRLNVHDGVYLENAVVTNRGGKAYLRAFNTNPDEVSIIVPSVKLEDVEIVMNPHTYSDRSSSPSKSPLSPSCHSDDTSLRHH